MLFTTPLPMIQLRYGKW